MVVSATLEPSSLSWMDRESTDGWEIESPHSVPRGTIVGVGESTAGVDSPGRTPQGQTLKLATRIGHQPLRILVDLGSNGNYIDGQVRIAKRINVEDDNHVEDVKMADGTTVRIEGRFQVILKCGGYRGSIFSRVCPNINKQMILGILWLSNKTTTLIGLRL